MRTNAKAKTSLKLVTEETHPAQKAGAAIHNGVVIGAKGVGTGVSVAGRYVFNFFRGIVKGA